MNDNIDLIQSVRRGNVDRVRYLVDQREVELNIRDEWDSTPLYYACLCGHYEVVEYLLQNGARCEPNTFDGERCRYGALTNQIRNLLKTYNVVTKHIIKRNNYDEFLRKIFEDAPYYDITFIIDEQIFLLHRCILSARSLFFQDALQTRWKDKKCIKLSKAKFNADSFEALVRYLYTGCCEISLDNVESVKALAKRCQLPRLYDLIEQKKTEIDDFRKNFAILKHCLEKIYTLLFLETIKCGNTMIYRLVIEPEPNDKYLNTDFTALCEQTIPYELRRWIASTELPFIDHLSDTFSDLMFIVDGYQFNIHRVFMCTRTEYFSVLIKNHFNEICQIDGKQAIILKNVRKELFIPILYYIYSDDCEIPDTYVDDLLILADEYMLPGLKRIVGNYYVRLLKVDNIIPVLRLARLFQLIKLENYCIRFIAENLEEIIDQHEFELFVVEDAASVQQRQETDSVQIIDDLRFYFTQFSTMTLDDIEDTSKKLRILDEFLQSIGLDI
ncbi:unnamed protein product [Didymodactylos carnosus]|uniref:BTB domain-containing protein n=1 Tax=Didymodactylos carnosus TaxID=1234261 RepID=A0A814B344_9BILA|nr:unnamed protein product [Didymodactylos carnosus]CAF3700521.1 unnamed protein product [Didymodactylos carnosus]